MQRNSDIYFPRREQFDPTHEDSEQIYFNQSQSTLFILHIYVDSKIIKVMHLHKRDHFKPIIFFHTLVHNVDFPSKSNFVYYL